MFNLFRFFPRMTRSLPAPGGSARVQWRWWLKEEETIRQVFASGTGLVGTSSSTAFLHCVNLCFNIYFLFVGSTFPLAPLQLHMTRLESICFPPIQFTKLEVCQKCHFNLKRLFDVIVNLFSAKVQGTYQVRLLRCVRSLGCLSQRSYVR